jgi:hypothetical protein
LTKVLHWQRGHFVGGAGVCWCIAKILMVNTLSVTYL